MTPALQMRISSSFPDFSRKVLAVCETELSEVWSQGMNVRFGEIALVSAMRASAA